MMHASHAVFTKICHPVQCYIKRSYNGDTYFYQVLLFVDVTLYSRHTYTTLHYTTRVLLLNDKTSFFSEKGGQTFNKEEKGGNIFLVLVHFSSFLPQRCGSLQANK